MFPTLMSKTFFLLFLSLAFTFIGAFIVVKFFRNAYNNKEIFVTAKKNKAGELDLVVAPGFLMKIFWPVLILDIAAFIFLMLVQHNFPLNVFVMFCYTFITGVMLGLALISVDENLAMKVAWLTAIITLFAGSIGLYSKIDFSFLSGILFWALIALIAVSFLRIFISIKGTAKRIIALIGVLIFVGYLLFDFGNLRKARKVGVLNNWLTALSFSIDIYLDIINLFLQLLDLLSED
ncbi:MAG: Bax inhibitor-1 family protein [Candidatus Margulisbacteria bacterium]|nr:Bax inhibitor-1 family protein [Candidatus Margulisiibacteriota bacterium]